MQTTNLVNQLNTNGTGAAQRNAASASNANASGSSGSQFSAMLSSEMQERLTPAATPDPTPAPAPAAPKPAPAKAQQADGAAHADETAAKADAAPAPDGKAGAADAAKDGDTADKADAKDADDSTAAAAADPAAAMLALMASLKHAGQAVATKGTPTAKAFDALGGGKSKGSDAAQLGALQTALKGKDTGLDAAAGVKPSALAADAAGDGKAAVAATPSETAFGAALAAVKVEGKAALDTSELGLQQARDAANLLAAQQDPAAIAQAQATQPAGFDAVQAAAASDTLSASVGTDAWNDQVGQKVIYMVGSEDQTAELTLNPPDLGPVQIVLSVSNDQASVAFSSNQEEVRQALEDALPRLREMMSESGIALGNATVNAGNGGNGQAQDGSSGSSRFGGGRRGSGDGDTGTVAEATVRPATRTTVLGDNGMVDTFA